MHSHARDVIEGRRPWAALRGDSYKFLTEAPDDCFDLVIGSPPYEDRRVYAEANFKLRGEEYVAWMVRYILQALRCCKGLVVIVCQGIQENWAYSAAPLLVAADLHRQGVHSRCPGVYFRNGIPGSGMKNPHTGKADFFRQDWEFCLHFQKGDGPLPYADAAVTGHPPKWAPGGEMSYRLPSGQRRNQWGGNESGVGSRRPNGKRQTRKRPSHTLKSTREVTKKVAGYEPPVLANPGNVTQQTYTAQQVADLLALYDMGLSDVTRCKVGGGLLGHDLAHENEAPFDLVLPTKYILSFTAKGGLVYDPWCGSGTTLHASIEHGRRCLTHDVRQSQVDTARRRAMTVTPHLFEVPAPNGEGDPPTTLAAEVAQIVQKELPS